MKRFKMSRSNSRRSFTASASRTHVKNVAGNFVMRGGLRL